MPRISKALQDVVRQRAKDVCEYCRAPAGFSEARFVCDHIVAQQHQGPTIVDNLAWCCAFCNYHKGPNLSGVDPVTGESVWLFNPRRDSWQGHFRWNGALIEGQTPTGRATVATLAINHVDRVAVRLGLIREGFLQTGKAGGDLT